MTSVAFAIGLMLLSFVLSKGIQQNLHTIRVHFKITNYRITLYHTNVQHFSF